MLTSSAPLTRQIIDNPAVWEDAIEHLMFDLYDYSRGIDTTHNVDDLTPLLPFDEDDPPCDPSPPAHQRRTHGQLHCALRNFSDTHHPRPKNYITNS